MAVVKRWVALVVVLALSAAVAGCAAGGAVAKEDMVGVWLSPGVEPGESGHEYELTLNGDHSFELIDTSVGVESETVVTAVSGYSGTWKMEGDLFTLTYAGSERVEECRLDSNTILMGGDEVGRFVELRKLR